MVDGLTFALPKGRILRGAASILAAAGFDTRALAADDRRLSIDLPGGHRVLLVKPIDVPTYVEYGVAELGIAGLDTLLEQGRDLYEPVDLGIGRCRLVVAEPTARPATLRRGTSVRVATKYPQVARRHYAGRGIDPEVIELSGSVELAAVTELADQIVDLVESGETLRQNGLREVETIVDVTGRLVVHPAASKLRPTVIAAAVAAIRAAATARQEVA
ncbi:MAG: ATP phosphoribosyltransferase [Deltaproteobacteria bacterium]|nr:ATP phosphoribosyltransferase [Deltaproteobacteria bacterium]MBK8235388.1 ATP phosphoribosyltransferase [Deltaproteobacteria bacterium]MBK8716292.1 ATP phosphoribosyltransferase [Deltaproteobacteria bacterium]MBP7291288.1 ATP phosphoribosyltransferase [Nannocystaceae bacterium]